MIVYDMNAWDHVIALIICILAPVLAFTSRKITVEDIKLSSEDKIRLYHSNALLLIVFALVVTTTWRFPGRPLAGLGFDLPVWHPYVTLLLAGIFFFYLLDIYFQYGTKKKRERSLDQKNNALAFIPTDHKEMGHFIFLAIAAGIGEEIIFRGYLIHYLLYWLNNDFQGILTACVASSALFAFLHGYQGFYSMIKIFFLSLMFSAIFVYTESLLIVILVHAVIDTLSGFVSVFVMKNRET